MPDQHPSVPSGIRRLFSLGLHRRDLIERDADDELTSLLEGRVNALVANGMPLDEARETARRLVGGDVLDARRRLRRSARRRASVSRVREWAADVALDVTHGIRGFRRDPAFAAFAVCTLALGIGANAAMFDIVDKLLLTGPADVRESARVVRLFWSIQDASGKGETTAAFDPRVYAALEQKATAFTGIAMYTTAYSFADFGEGAAARLIPHASATANLMQVLGTRPALGRFFTIDEQHNATTPPVVVLGYEFWQTDFGADSSVLGRSVQLSGQPYTVIGVTPKGFTGPDLNRVDVWVPLRTKAGPVHWGPGASSGPGIVAGLKPGITNAQAALDATTAHRAMYDGTSKRYAEARLLVGPLRYGPGGTEASDARISRWLMGVSVIVLLVACANLVNLLLARAIRTRREMAIRLALGSGPGRLVRIVLAGSLLLAGIGALAGLAVAFVVDSAVRRVLLPTVDWTTGPVATGSIVFSVVVACVTGVVIGMVPAWRAARSDLTTSLKTGIHDGGGRRSLMQRVLLVSQATLAMLLLVGAGLFVRSLERVRRVDLGIQLDRLVVLSPRWPRIPDATPPEDRTKEYQRRNNFARDVLTRLRAMPSVQDAATASGMPFRSTMSVDIRVPGWDSLPHLPGEVTFSVGPEASSVTPGYFATMGTKLLVGRHFTAEDRPGAELVAIVSRTMAATLWPGTSAIGQCFIIHPKQSTTCTRVVGVVQDVHRGQIHEGPVMRYYVPLGQQPGFGADGDLVVRPRGDAQAAIPGLRAVLRQIDPSIRFVDAIPLVDLLEPQTRSWRVGAMMFSVFGGLALVVAAVGVFSTVAYLIEQRRHEIGVRLALGSSEADLLQLFAGETVTVTTLGAALGVLLALAAAPLVQPLLFETSASDPLVIGAMAATLVLVALLASGIPGLRVRGVDPAAVLRDE